MKIKVEVKQNKDGYEDVTVSEPIYVSDKSIGLLDIHNKMEEQRAQILKKEVALKLERIMRIFK